MAMNVTQQFLVYACRAAGGEDYFRWQGVGTSLGLSDDEARHAVSALDERKLVRLLTGGDARLLVAGRQMGARLEGKLKSIR